MSSFNHIVVNDSKPDSPQMKNREHKQSQQSKGITKDPHGLGLNKMGKRNQHMIIHKSQIGQQIILRKLTHDNT